jgi:hypothetical protein
MERLRITSLLFLPVLLPAILVSVPLLNGQNVDGQSVNGQSPNPATSSDHQSAPTSTAQSAPTPASPVPAIAENAPHMLKQTRFEIIRDFETQVVYARAVFPMGAKGLKLKGGVISPNGLELQQALALWGPAVRPGDPSRISYVQIKDDHIHFEINGGPIRHKKWYQRIEVSGTGGTPVPTPGNDEPATNPHGTYLDLYFDKYVPEMTARQLVELLFPVLDFNARNKEEAYLNTVPPKVKAAIQAHQVLVGMNTEMVLHAKGKAPKKVRERDGETEYEEWIYGEPPQDVDFVRIVSDEVVRVEIMKVGGQKIVRTEKEVILEKPDRDTEAKKEQEERPANAPSLRRPGEDSDEVPKPADGASPIPPSVSPSAPQPPGNPGPGGMAAGGK